jgi:hypothetical protein
MYAVQAPTVRFKPCRAPRCAFIVALIAGAGCFGAALAQDGPPAPQTPPPANLFPPADAPPRDLKALFDPSPAGPLHALARPAPADDCTAPGAPGCGEGRESPPLKEIGRGLAAWYDLKNRTASGEHYDAGAFTAGHRTLPFGSEVRVVNTRNGRSVTVRITDRGPYTTGRVIDLSRAAARALDMTGVDRVVLYAPDAPDVTATGSVNADRRRAPR